MLRSPFRRLLFLTPFAIPVLGVITTAAADDLPAKVTYDEHIRPIFKDHCLSCHNANDKKSGLGLDNYTSTMEGGSGGEALVAGDLESSRLWALTAHVETPKMPPNADRIADGKLALIKRWIEQGMPENNGSKVMAPKVDLSQMGSVSLARPEGPLPMPETMLRQTPLFTERPASISALAASPWSPLVAVGGQEQVSLYHSQSGELLGILPFPEGEPQSITFSRDGKLILVGGGRHSAGGYAVLYEIKTGKRITRVGDELDIVMAADLSDDNSKIALAGPQKLVRVYETSTGKQLFELKKHTDWVYALRFSPDGVLIASADRSNGLVVWEADTGKLYLDLIGHKNEIRSLAWRPDSLALVSASLDGTLKLWDMNAGKLIKSWDAHGGGAIAVASCNDGTFVSTGQDKKVKLWKSNGDAAGEMPPLPDTGLEVAVTADAKEVVAGDWQGNVRLWERANPKNEKSLRSNPLTLEKAIQEAEGQVAVLKKAADDAKTGFEAANAQAVAEQAKHQNAEQAVAGAVKAIEAAQAEVEAAKKQSQPAEQAVQASIAEIEKQRKSQQELANQQAVLKAQGKDDPALQGKLDAVVKSIDPLEAKLKEQRNDLVAKNSLVAAAEAKLAVVIAKRPELEKARDAAKAPAEAAAKKAADAKAPYDSAVNALASHTKRIDSMKAELTRFVETKKSWTDKSTAIAQQSKTLEERSKILQAAVDLQAKAEQEAKSKVAALKQELDKLQKAVQAAEQQQQAAAKTLVDKQAEMDKQLGEMGQLQAELAGLKLQLDSYRN